MNAVELLRRQRLPLSAKIELSNKAIQQFYEVFDGQVYVSYSGGKDSNALLHMVRKLYPDVKAVNCRTGLELPEINDHIKETPDVTVITPKMTFYEVIKTKGYPIISKEQACYIREYRTTKSEYLKKVRWEGKGEKHRFKIAEKWKFLVNAPFKISEECCDIQKKNPFKKFNKQTGLRPFIGTMAADSRNRFKEYLAHGCNNFERVAGEQSTPVGFWTERDIWKYLKAEKVPYCKLYDCGVEHPGCIYCMFGIHLEKQSRFAVLNYFHPNLYEYCMNVLGLKEVLEFIHYDFRRDKLYHPTLNTFPNHPSS